METGFANARIELVAQVDRLHLTIGRVAAELRADIFRQLLTTVIGANAAMVALVFGIVRLSG